MTKVFVDTSFYIALVNPRDINHAKARDLATKLRAPRITTDFVLVEVGNWLSRSNDRSVFMQLMKSLQADPQTQIQPATRSLFEEGVVLYANRLDKNWSLTDCISFVVMKNQTLSEALTSDHHFEQAGYSALLQ